MRPGRRIFRIGRDAKEFAAIERIWIVACGTSWHAGLVGNICSKKWSGLRFQVDIGSEFRYRDPLSEEMTYSFISQSGETADTLAAAQRRAKGARVVSIVNVVGSTLARKSDGVPYTTVGRRSVWPPPRHYRATRPRCNSSGLAFSRVRNDEMKAVDGKAWLGTRLVQLPVLVKRVLQREAEIVAIAKRYYKKRNFGFWGAASD